jgi:hypothetical protein
MVSEHANHTRVPRPLVVLILEALVEDQSERPSSLHRLVTGGNV